MEETARRSNHQPGHQDKADRDRDHDTDPDPWPPRSNRVQHHVLVVQIPKDQIYRVPPPENALIVERHRNPETKRRDPPCFCCFKSALGICIFVSVVLLFILLLVLALVPSIPSLFMMPNDPVFSIDQFAVKNSKTHFEFDVKVKVENKNPAVGISYEDDGEASLSSKKNVGTVKFPSLSLGRGDDMGSVKLVFKGSTGNLPKDLQKSLNSSKPKVAVSFAVDMDVRTRMKVGISSSRIIKFTVSCSFKVDSLAAANGKGRVVSQQCESNRKIS